MRVALAAALFVEPDVCLLVSKYATYIMTLLSQRNYAGWQALLTLSITCPWWINPGWANKSVSTTACAFAKAIVTVSFLLYSMTNWTLSSYQSQMFLFPQLGTLNFCTLDATFPFAAHHFFTAPFGRTWKQCYGSKATYKITGIPWLWLVTTVVSWMKCVRISLNSKRRSWHVSWQAPQSLQIFLHYQLETHASMVGRYT